MLVNCIADHRGQKLQAEFGLNDIYVVDRFKKAKWM